MRIAFIIDDYIIDPLGIAWLSSYLKKAGFEVALIKATGDWIKKVIDYNPKMVCYSVLTANFRHYVELNNLLQKWFRVFALFGGPHCTFFPDCAKNEPFIDAMVRGEGFDAIVDVAKAVENDEPIDDIPNVNGNLLRPVKPKDHLLLPDRDLIYQFPKNFNNPIRNVMATFNCPMSCSYCLDGDTLILMADGSAKPIKNISVGEKIIGITNIDKEYVTTEVEAIWKTVKPAVKITMENGTETICSPDHRWLTSTGEWKYALRESLVGKWQYPGLTTNDFIKGYFESEIKVADITPLQKFRTMYDMTTGTGNFIANGLVSHNCYARRWRELYGLRGAEFRPVDDVIDEIYDLMRYPVGLIYFQDDTFPLYHKRWIYEFIEKYSKIRIPFHIQIRIEMVKKEMIDDLVKVGLHGVTYAVESSNEKFRREVLNRQVSNEVIVRNNQILRDAGLHVRVENMLGAPGETYEMALETLKFNAKLAPDIGWSSVFQPYPGTKLGDQYFDEKQIFPEDFFSYQLDGDYRIANLQKFFALGVKMPKLIPLINQLTKLPQNRIYSAIYHVVKQYLYDRRLYKL